MFKKRLMSFALVMVMGLSLVACNSKDKNTTDATDTTTVAAGEETTTAPFNKIDTSNLVWSDYVTLGEYKGIEVQVKSVEVTEDDIQAKVDSLLSYYATSTDVTDRAVQDGDVVNIDYTGYIDGVAFDGGSATGASLTIGSGQFIDGFETGLIGANIGDEVKLNLTFPNPYLNNPDYAGKAVQFDVKVNSIQVKETPELTDEFIANNTSYKTVDEYKASVKESLEASKAEDVKSDKLNNVWNTIIDNCTVISYPEELVAQYQTEMNDYYEQIATNYYGKTLEEYITGNGSTMDDFNKKTLEYGQTSAISEMIARGIAEKESITVSDDEVKEYAQSLIDDGTVTGFDDVDAVIEYYSQNYLRLSLTFQKVLEYVEEQAVEKTATVTE
ncbi:trigger factor [Falcatimonas sp. MSJ-15]|uniref:trigger factor n=1 Tax=Falcatimonas sp. MSJ-15 TaxID=2841515 RepID=UPI001C0FB0AC|nr:trigger factor [Falcatimonas sp. MSJ-15]MBU5469353.1 trigger factor [Falcatimonas sp. MSJ-15]